MDWKQHRPQEGGEGRGGEGRGGEGRGGEGRGGRREGGEREGGREGEGGRGREGGRDETTSLKGTPTHLHMLYWYTYCLSHMEGQ